MGVLWATRKAALPEDYLRFNIQAVIVNQDFLHYHHRNTNLSHWIMLDISEVSFQSTYTHWSPLKIDYSHAAWLQVHRSVGRVEVSC
jgi:hypothetical protein